jgi:hypothetical protein
VVEDLETRWAIGEEIDPQLSATMGNAQRRLLAMLGRGTTLRTASKPRPLPNGSPCYGRRAEELAEVCFDVAERRPGAATSDKPIRNSRKARK